MSEVYDQMPFDLTNPTQHVRRSDSAINRAYSVRASTGNRGGLLESTRIRILDEHDWTCQYCGRGASVVDHIIPWAYGGTDEDSNLAASCHLCNAIASDNVFEDFAAKRAHILEARSKRHEPPPNLCVECGQPFYNGARGATRFMCSRCNHDDLRGITKSKQMRKERRRIAKVISRAL